MSFPGKNKARHSAAQSARNAKNATSNRKKIVGAQKAAGQRRDTANTRRSTLRSSTAKKKSSGEKNWIKGAVKKPGALHRDLGVPQGKKIPPSKIAAAAKGSGTTAKRARLAQTFSRMRKK